eukprot:1479018-Rhodomonas_salina.2
MAAQDKSAIDTEEKDKDNKKTIKVRLECARGNEGLWYQGPTKIVTGHFIGGDDVWNFEETVRDDLCRLRFQPTGPHTS